MNYEGFTMEQLKAERELINARIKEMRNGAKASLKEEANERETWARENVNEGDVVTFMYGAAVDGMRPTASGKVVRASEKSVTVEFEVEGETLKRYRKYSDIIPSK